MIYFVLVLKCHCFICKLRQKLLKRQLFEARSAVICQLMNLTNDTVGRSVDGTREGRMG